jgi:hypothetical protein
MDTECSEQQFFSDLCVHRVSVVNLLGLTFMTVGILNHRGTMDTEFSEQRFFPTSVFIVSLGLTFWVWHS